MEKEFHVNSQIKARQQFFFLSRAKKNPQNFEVIYLKSFTVEQTGSCLALFLWKLKHEGWSGALGGREGGINCCFGTSKPGTDIQSPG